MNRARLAGVAAVAITAAGPVPVEAAPIRAAPGTVDTWTVLGCTIKLANTFDAAHGRVRAHWHTDGTVTCTGSELDAEARIDLVRNRVAVPNSFARAGCTVTSLDLCTLLHVTHDTPYHPPRAKWQARLVLFIRGPVSLPAAVASTQCVVDIPSFETICTFVGRSTRR